VEDGITRGMVVNCVAYAHGHRIKDIPIEEISNVLKQEGMLT
jgi:hypothetical protein